MDIVEMGKKMTKYNFDEEIHAIDKKEAYIIARIDNGNEMENFYKKKSELATKYANYLYENDKEFCLDIIAQRYILNEPSQLYEFIYKPVHEFCSLNRFSSLALTFKRCEHDGLDMEDKKNETMEEYVDRLQKLYNDLCQPNEEITSPADAVNPAEQKTQWIDARKEKPQGCVFWALTAARFESENDDLGIQNKTHFCMEDYKEIK